MASAAAAAAAMATAPRETTDRSARLDQCQLLTLFGMSSMNRGNFHIGYMAALQIAEGAKTMLQHNICTEDGLVNGAMGIMVSFEWPEGHRTAKQQLGGLHSLFDDCRVGRMTRNSAEHLLTIVCPVTTNIMSKNDRFTFEQYQGPIVWAWAVTIHEIHGLSLDKAAIDLGRSVLSIE